MYVSDGDGSSMLGEGDSIFTLLRRLIFYEHIPLDNTSTALTNVHNNFMGLAALNVGLGGGSKRMVVVAKGMSDNAVSHSQHTYYHHHHPQYMPQKIGVIHVHDINLRVV